MKPPPTRSAMSSAAPTIPAPPGARDDAAPDGRAARQLHEADVLSRAGRGVQRGRGKGHHGPRIPWGLDEAGLPGPGRDTDDAERARGVGLAGELPQAPRELVGEDDLRTFDRPPGRLLDDVSRQGRARSGCRGGTRSTSLPSGRPRGRCRSQRRALRLGVARRRGEFARRRGGRPLAGRAAGHEPEAPDPEAQQEHRRDDRDRLLHREGSSQGNHRSRAGRPGRPRQERGAPRRPVPAVRLVETLAQAREPALEPRPRRLDRHAETAGHLGHGQVLLVAQQQGRPVRLLHREHRVEQPPSRFLLRDEVGHRRNAFRARGGALAAAAAPAPAQHAIGEVPRDGPEPRAQRSRTPRPPRHRDEPRALHDVLDLLVGAEDGAGHGPYEAGMDEGRLEARGRGF